MTPLFLSLSLFLVAIIPISYGSGSDIAVLNSTATCDVTEIEFSDSQCPPPHLNTPIVNNTGNKTAIGDYR